MLYLLASTYMSKLKVVIETVMPICKWLEVDAFKEIYLALTSELYDQRYMADKIILEESCLEERLDSLDVRVDVLSKCFKEVILITQGKTNQFETNIKRIGKYQSVHHIINCFKEEHNKLILYSNLVSSDDFSDLFIRLSKTLKCSYRLSLNFPVMSQTKHKDQLEKDESKENIVSLYDYNLYGKLNLRPHQTYQLIDNLTDYIMPPIDLLMNLIRETSQFGDTLIETNGVKSPLDFELINACHWIILVFSKSTETFVNHVKNRFPNKKYILIHSDDVHFKSDEEITRHITAQIGSGAN